MDNDRVTYISLWDEADRRSRWRRLLDRLLRRDPPPTLFWSMSFPPGVVVNWDKDENAVVLEFPQTIDGEPDNRDEEKNDGDN